MKTCCLNSWYYCWYISIYFQRTQQMTNALETLCKCMKSFQSAFKPFWKHWLFARKLWFHQLVLIIWRNYYIFDATIDNQVLLVMAVTRGGAPGGQDPPSFEQGGLEYISTPPNFWNRKNYFKKFNICIWENKYRNIRKNIRQFTLQLFVSTYTNG